jgi:hypothetical protein
MQNNNPETLGYQPAKVANGDYAVAPSGKPLVEQCTTEQVIKQRKCGDVKILVLDAAKMPFISRNIRLAWGEGKPFVLTRNSALKDVNRGKACNRFRTRVGDWESI